MQINDQSLIYIALLILVSLALLLISLLILYVRLLNRYLAVKEGRSKEVDPARHLAEAQIRAQKILEEAHFKARETVEKSNQFLKLEESAVVTTLEKANLNFTKLYSDALSQITKDSGKILQALPQEIKLLMVSSIDNFRQSLQKEVAATQAKVADSMSQSFKAAEAEVENYKKLRQTQIDKEAVKLVVEVTKKVLGKEISTDEHEKLVLKSLEEAKRQGIL